LTEIEKNREKEIQKMMHDAQKAMKEDYIIAMNSNLTIFKDEIANIRTAHLNI
jgi:hypothetical protein